MRHVRVEEAVSFPGDRDGWVRVTKDLGLQFDFVSSEQVEQGGLTSGKYKVLILPLSLALSEEELKSIEAFARGGGTVIADAGAGVTDEHCAWRADGSLEKLFGVKSASAPGARKLKDSGEKLTLTDAGAAFGIRAEDLAGLNAAEPGLKAAGGEALARAGDADAVIVRRVGSGRTIYLNALLDRYAKLRAEKSGGDAQRALVNALLERAGVRPAIEALSADGRRLTHALVARYKFGESEVLTVVTDNVALEGVVGRDGVTVYNDAGLGRVARQEMTVRLPRKAYVTDVRTGKRFGFTDAVRTSVVVGDALVLGLSPAEGSVTLSGPPSAALGAHVRFGINVAAAGRHLVRCHFFAPDGSMLEAYAKNVVAEDGRAAVVLPSALNDPAGVYTLRVTDVVTGATAEAKLELK